MKKTQFTALIALACLTIAGCSAPGSSEENETATDGVVVDRFADIQVLRYELSGWDKLSLDQKKLVYYLSQAGLAGRDIIYDQNNAYNLEIRKALEKIADNADLDKTTESWKALETYTKQVWFSNGIHHHYSMDKIKPGFDKAYFKEALKASNASLSNEAMEAMFSKTKYMKRKVKDANVDMIQASANNFYGKGVTQEAVEAFYNERIDVNDPEPIEYGLNSTLILKDGKLYEDVWKSGGKYGKAIDKITYWLKKAVTVAENDQQTNALIKLIEFYETGDLNVWDEYNVLWAASTEGDIDYINGFIETYGDALGKRGTYESIVEINDFEASKRMKVVAENAQWFEDNSPLMPEHKKKKVVGVSYKVVQVAS